MAAPCLITKTAFSLLLSLTASFIILIGPLRRVKTVSVKLGCMSPSPFRLIFYDLFFFVTLKL